MKKIHELIPPFKDGEQVKIKETGEIVTVDHWWHYSNKGPDNRVFQYNIKEKTGTWYAEYELETL